MAALEDVKQEVRGRLGDLEEAKLPDPEIERTLLAGLRELSRYRPLSARTDITLVAGQMDYPLPAGAIGVSGLDVKSMEQATNDPFLRQFGGDLSSLEVDRWLDGLLESAEVFQTEGSPPTLRILEDLRYGAPGIAGGYKVYVTYEVVRTLEQLSEDLLETLLKYALGECLQYLARKRSKAVVKIPTATGYLTLDTGELFATEGARLVQEFHCRLGRDASVIGMG